MRRRVDLPQPDGPINETNSPGAMRRLISDRAVMVPPGTMNSMPTWSSRTASSAWDAGATVVTPAAHPGRACS
jgi:hypothetical protein